MKISVCGKGGSGKSTVTALLAKQALKRDLQVLVVDADYSNSGLFKMLGFDRPPSPLLALAGGKAKVKEVMGHNTLLTQQRIYTRDIPAEYICKRDGLMQVGIGKILQALEGCACPMGVLSREFLKKLYLEDGQIAIVDMEAGIEHFGRGIDATVDRVLVVVEPSFDSLNVAWKIRGLAAGMNKKVSAVLNKTPNMTVAQKMIRDLDAKGILVLGTLPYDPVVFETCWEGLVSERGAAFDAAGKVLDALLASN
jgi:CO dehydrogenase maturation factor